MNRDRETVQSPADLLVRHVLDSTLDELSASELARLRAARATALAARRRPAPAGGRPWLASSALATAALLLLMLNLRLSGVDGARALDAELVRSAVTLEMLEDLEFYEWLDADGAAG